MYRVLPLDPALDRTAFRCGNDVLDHYFRERVGQDIRRRFASCFVALDEHRGIVGFYTLAATSILLDALPVTVLKKLLRYPLVPAIRMGRLAVDQAARGLGLGGALLADALGRSASSEIAAYALVVDAKDNAAVAFYEHHGFVRFVSEPRSLFLPLATIMNLQR